MNAAGYNFIIKSSTEYEFYTSIGAGYSISFESVSDYFVTDHPVKAYIFSVDVQLLYPGPYNHYDFITGITIAEIILHFFNADRKRVIFYLCDPVDGKMLARSRKFKYWYKIFGNRDFKKIEAQVNINGVSIELNFIFLTNNTYAYDIPLIIEEAKNRLNNK